MSKTSITTHTEAKICKYTLPQFGLIGKDNKKSVKVVNIFWMILDGVWQECPSDDYLPFFSFFPKL